MSECEKRNGFCQRCGYRACMAKSAPTKGTAASVIDVLQDIIDRIQDDGDRCYLGSTNDVDRLKRIAADIEKMRGDLAVEARSLIQDLRAQAGA